MPFSTSCRYAHCAIFDGIAKPIPWYPPLFGFIPDSTNVATQVAAINNVYTQYNNSLTYGDVDPEVYLPEFLKALEEAGINDVMAEYQRQVDEWLANK